MPRSFGQFIKQNAPILLDGGLATTLESNSARLDSHLWSAKLLIEAPEEIQWAHEQFLSAESQVISTASYQFSHQSVSDLGYTKSASDDLLRQSVQLAKQAIQAIHPEHEEDFFVAASLGPFGATLGNGSEYTGDYGVHGLKQIMRLHDERIEVLSTTNVDVLAFETIPRADEALAIVQRMQDFPTMEFWLSFQLRDAEHLANGDNLADVISQVQQCKNLAAIGLNCLAPTLATAALKLATSRSKKPLFIYANSGENYDGGTWSNGEENDDFLFEAKKWLALGATGVGGCCRTSPITIARLAELIKNPTR